ncbi:hypothetical protein EJ02DRAFT_432881 [Clathrospora elynae]|uniref:Uncharacterized protein n=1 Tax=Clathrospora elynae TaxID=706981 RepID=A0A6A5STJ8_9PLEO|nr:hypothetical protein EJ02DRAFT_432881 [Clathrospora elynae]
MYAFIPILAFLTNAFAATSVSNADHCCPTREPKCAEYEDLTFNDGAASPIPSPYNGLDYQTFQVDQYDGFISPASGKQWAISYEAQGLIGISDESSLTTFDLHSLSYACVAGIPQPECAILIFGFKKSDDVVTRTLIFPRLDPGHSVEQFVMNSTTFGDEWTGLTDMAFGMTRSDDGGSMFGGLAIDDLRYTLNTAC